VKSFSLSLVGSVVILIVVVFVSNAFARGSHRGAGGERVAGGNPCNSAAMLDLSLSVIDIMIKTSGAQAVALDELKKVVKVNSDGMLRVCSGQNLISVPAKLAAAEQRLEVALTGVRKIRPVAEKFYATLNDEQKAQANNLLDWRGL
jgi:hypothetical protein